MIPFAYTGYLLYVLSLPGVHPPHYQVVETALLRTLQAGLGDQFKEDHRKSWAAIFKFLSKAMVDGSTCELKIIKDTHKDDSASSTTPEAAAAHQDQSEVEEPKDIVKLRLMTLIDKNSKSSSKAESNLRRLGRRRKEYLASSSSDSRLHDIRKREHRNQNNAAFYSEAYSHRPHHQQSFKNATWDHSFTLQSPAYITSLLRSSRTEVSALPKELGDSSLRMTDTAPRVPGSRHRKSITCAVDRIEEILLETFPESSNDSIPKVPRRRGQDSSIQEKHPIEILLSPPKMRRSWSGECSPSSFNDSTASFASAPTMPTRRGSFE
jgi:hypothetical protein